MGSVSQQRNVAAEKATVTGTNYIDSTITSRKNTLAQHLEH